MSESIKVSKIEIKIGKQVISLTPDELKSLKLVLEQTFPTKLVENWFIPAPLYIPYPQPVCPVYPSSPTIDPWRPFWSITCQNDNQTVCLSLNGIN